MKKLLPIILILCLALSFGCGKKDKPTNTPDTPDGPSSDVPTPDKPTPDTPKPTPGSSGSETDSPSVTPDKAQPLEWTDRIFTGTFTDEAVTKDALVLLTVYLPKVSGCDEIEMYYQGRLDKIKQQAQTTYLDLGRGNYQFASQGIGIFTPVTVELGYRVLRNDGKLFSVRREIYENTGGAHPLITLACETFRVSDGALMIFSDLFSVDYDAATAALKPIVEEQMDKKVKEFGAEYFYDNAKENLLDMWDKSDWYITDDALVMVWQTYAISPYVAGVQEFMIPLTRIADIVDAQWIS